MKSARELRAQLTAEERQEEREWANSLSFEEIEEYVYDSVCDAYDGCRVEPDGICSHGYSSPLLLLDIM